MASFAGQPGTGGLTAKLEAVGKLMEKLATDLEKQDLTTEQRDAALEEVKVHGRDPRSADPIFTKEGITTLTRHAFDTPATTTSHNALRCLANAMLIKPEVRQVFVDLGCETKACEQLKRDTWDDEFLCSRVIFLTTYGTNVDLAKLIDDNGLAVTIIAKLANHAKIASNPGKAVADPMQDMALADTLKLMFNVSHFCKPRVESFTPAVPHILTLLTKRDISPSRPLDGPFTYKDADLEQTVTPLVSVLRSIHESAPEDVQKIIRNKVLPTKDDREMLRDAISHFLFELSDKDASKFVENVGYGFASGFLFQNNIPVPQNAVGADGAAPGSRPVNPITGQFQDQESGPDLPEMTEEEKEREAERLFVLFERLKKTGIVDVQNPVEQAFREGRFQDIKDDERVEELD
ncbi:putative guanine nucleotide exchange factor synembryn [Diaporthe ampelina]|uniref:Putative guanine nucleotide exchange factor synembryn n=1 Tax=Diaporthe ampelina TaxID=1214573 RepID=A0A0G2F4V2_9PEZI|nr:putative guanine nucleotide exchange factor synembryn [Diaporthe ampelina]